jgi:hypothetical protein
MTDKLEIEPSASNVGRPNMADAPEGLRAWFLKEVLPLEAALTQFFRSRRRNHADVAELLPEVLCADLRVCAKKWRIVFVFLPDGGELRSAAFFVVAKPLRCFIARADQLVP